MRLISTQQHILLQLYRADSYEGYAMLWIRAYLQVVVDNSSMRNMNIWDLTWEMSDYSS